MFEVARKAAGLTQEKASFETGIPKKKIISYEGKFPRIEPGDPSILDKTYTCNGQLVLWHCCNTCPEGQYLGLQYPDMRIQDAGLQIISIMGDAEMILPKIADLALTYATTGQIGSRHRDLCTQLSNLRQCIQALELKMRGSELPRDNRSVSSIRAFILKKEKAACTAPTAQTVMV